MAIVSTELLSHSFHTTSQLKPTSHSHHPTTFSCRPSSSSSSSISNGRNNTSRNLTRVSVSAEPKPTHLQNHDYKETHLIKVLNRSCKAGQYNEAFYFLELMVNKGYKPDVILCTKLIKGFFNSRNIEKAIRVMQILEQYGEPDLFSYNALISGFCKANRIESANKVLDRMKSQGFKPDVVTYNIMIGSLCSRGKLGLARKVMDRLVKDNCKPTVITYTILIEATILDGGIDEAMKLLDEMLSRGLRPDMYTYNAIVRGMCREGMLDRAFEFVRSFDAKGCAPNVISYNILLRALLNRGKWEEGENLVSNMCARGCEPNVVTYSILISTLCRDGKVEDAVNVLKIMKEKGLTPDAYSYDPLISTFCKEGRLDLAIEFLDCMISDGCLPDIVNYNTILAALCKNGSADQALEIFENLGEVGCPPNVSSYNTMFSALWNCGDRVRALGMVSDMVSKGIEPRGYPCLSKRHQKLVSGFFNHSIQIVLSGQSVHCLTKMNSDIAANNNENNVDGVQKHPLRPYLDYVGFLYQRMDPLPEQERFELGYRDFLQSPLQPLMDNLEAQTYETFEKDTTKYIQYQRAIAKALQDRVPDEKSSTVTTVLMVVGAGRGPLVRASLQAAEETGRRLKVYAVEKNPNAVVTLHSLVKLEGWENIVSIISSDMRHWDAPEKADILVSELLGSFGDNELSPECLDGAQKFLKEDGISIPSSYTSFIHPVTASKLYNDVKAHKDVAHFETAYVVKLHNIARLAPPQPVFTFTHPNRSIDKSNSRYTKLKFEIPGDTGSAMVHGFAGYFDSILYKEVHLGIEPSTSTPNMFSWFPIFFPLRTPICLRPGSSLEVHFWRCCSPTKVWYEWGVASPSSSSIHNSNGRSYWVGL